MEVIIALGVVVVGGGRGGGGEGGGEGERDGEGGMGVEDPSGASGLMDDVTSSTETREPIISHCCYNTYVYHMYVDNVSS